MVAIQGGKEGTAEGPAPLTEVYAGKVRITVVEAFSDEGKAARVKYGFGDQLHGTVGIGPGGETLFILPGHQYGRDEIVAAIDKILR